MGQKNNAALIGRHFVKIVLHVLSS